MPAPHKPKPINGFILPANVTNPEAIAEFTRITGLLTGEKKQIDLSLLVDFAITHGEILKLRSVIANEGEVLVSEKTGSYYTNPRVNILANKVSHLSKLREDLLFTPKSRKDKIEKPKKKTLAESLE